MKPIVLSGIAAFLCITRMAAQCGVGEIEVTMQIYTDPWAYETYWQLTPAGAGCGNDVIAEGANLNVNCAGTASGNSPNGYANNTMYTEGPFCLTEGQDYDLIFVDSYGDGGLVFEVFENGLLTHVYYGGGSGNVWTFTAGVSAIPSYDQPCFAEPVIVDGPAVAMSNVGAIAAYGEISAPGGSCALYGLWCEGASTNSVWASFIAEEGVSYRISTCNPGTAFDTQVAVWTASDCGDFDTFDMVGANDDAIGGCSGANGYSSVCYVSCLEAGSTVYIQIDGYYAQTGNFSISVETYESAPTLNAQVNDVSCPLSKGEDPNGSIVPYLTGAGINFSCEWTGPGGFSSGNNTINGLGTGEYLVTVTTSCGTTIEGSYTIEEPAPWNVTAIITHPSCPQSVDGAINLGPSGGTSPYDISWQGPENFQALTEDISGLLPGAYALLIEDERGCDYAFTYQLVAQNDLEVYIGADTTVCLGESFVITAPVGLIYQWQDGSQNQFYIFDTDEWGVGEHSVILTASTEDGCAATDAMAVVVEICESVHEVTAPEFQLFPNPSNGQFTIEREERTAAVIRILDASGRLVLHTALRAEELRAVVNVDIAPGIYQVVYTSGGTSASRSLIIE